MAFTTNQLVQATGTATVKSIANSDVVSLLGLDGSVKYKGAWVMNSDYALDDLIYDGSVWYICISAIINSTTAPASDATHFKSVGGGSIPNPFIDDYNQPSIDYKLRILKDAIGNPVLEFSGSNTSSAAYYTDVYNGNRIIGDGSGLTGVIATDSGAARKSANLSDLASASTSRINLGLGDSATKNVGTTAGTVAAGNDSRFSPSQIAKNSGYVSTDGYVLAHDSFGNEVLLFGALRTSCDIFAGGRNNADGSQRVFCSGVGLTPVAASGVANGVLFADSSNGNKLSFKDSGGTVHALY